MLHWRQECRHSGSAFTLIELLIVISIIIVLAGLILGTSGYVQKKGQRSRAEAEIAAMSAALENYKADNGIYPQEPATDNLNAQTDINPNDYPAASLVLYHALSGATSGSRTPTEKSYFAFKPNMLSPRDVNEPVAAIRDPFGNSYGYSTANQAYPEKGFNPTFDLWSTGGDLELGDTPPRAHQRWIKNW